jgi:hypothetical protein
MSRAIASIKERMVTEIKSALSVPDVMVGPDWDVKVEKRVGNASQLRVTITAPNKVIRYHFNVVVTHAKRM